MEFSGKVVLVTGASRGIGAETARQFAARGASLYLTGRDDGALARVSKECLAAGSPAVATLAGDIADEPFQEQLIASVITKLGRLDALVNNAGVAYTNNLSNLQPQLMEQMFQVNLFAVTRLTSLATPHLIKTKGNVVNVSSIAGLRSFASLLGYCMSKGGLDQMTRCAALELGPKGVRVNCVNPGTIEETEIQRRGGLSEEEYEEYLARARTAHALGRNGKPGEVAGAIVFLASPLASFITGVCLPVDGGRQAMCPASFK